MSEVAFNVKSKAAYNYAQDYLLAMDLKSKYSLLFQPAD